MTMPILTLAAAGAAALIALPFALPDARIVEREATIPAKPAAIYTLLESAEGFQRFNPYRDADPDLRVELAGPARGVGSAFSFTGKDGAGTQTITAVEPDRSVTMEIDLGALGKPVQTFTIDPVDGGARVVWSVESRFGANPIKRVFGLFMDGMFGPTYERGLANLAHAVTAG